MITQKQIQKLQAYADSVNTDITVSFDGDLYVVVAHSGETFMRLPNKPASGLTMKSVTHHINNCAKWAKETQTTGSC